LLSPGVDDGLSWPLKVTVKRKKARLIPGGLCT
jgi:hypothetical protein